MTHVKQTKSASAVVKEPNVKHVAERVTKEILKRVDQDLSGKKIFCKADNCGKLVPEDRLRNGWCWIKGHLRKGISKKISSYWKTKAYRKKVAAGKGWKK